jgi:hypothetical protein
MAVSLPADLPFCPIDGTLDGAIQENRTEAPADLGPASHRRRYSGTFEIMSFECIYTRQQYQSLLDFFHGDCGGGALPMLAPNIDDRSALSEYTWVAPPSRRPHVPNMSKLRVTFSLIRKVR